LTLFDIASEFARPEMAQLFQTYSETFHPELGSNIVETIKSNLPPTTSVLYAIDILQQIGALDNM
jgi:hypothetical protein